MIFQCGAYRTVLRGELYSWNGAVVDILSCEAAAPRMDRGKG
jgi:hypothetical protein